MFDKLKFNNLVISNKKAIQQSRIQTINKLVQKIRKFKSLLEKYPNDNNCKNRIRKSTEIMELLKKLKVIDIMKKVLLMDKPASAVVTNGTSTPEEVSVALLCMNKLMLDLVKRFKTELKINASENVEWRRDLMELSKRRQKIKKTEEKRRNRLELKQQKILGRKRQEWLEENQHELDGSIAIEVNSNNSSTAAWKIEEKLKNNIEIDIKTDSISVKKSDTPMKRKSWTQDYLVSNNTQEHNIRIESQKDESKKLKRLTMVDDRPNNLLQNSKLSQSERTNDTLDDDAASLTIDPFFITDTGENYKSTAIIKTDNIAEHRSNNGKRNLHMVKLNTSEKTPVGLKDSFQSRTVKNQKKLGMKNKWNNENEVKVTLNNNLEIVTDTGNIQMKHISQNKIKSYSGENKNLHPSWVAKQKLKPYICGFQGKRTLFDDEDISKSNRNNVDSKINKSANMKLNTSENDTLHPSWVAKKKLKPCITAFQGKKITFDNDE